MGVLAATWITSGAAPLTNITFNPNTLYLVATTQVNSAANLSDVTVATTGVTWARIGNSENVGTSSPTKRIELWYTMVTSTMTGKTIACTTNNASTPTVQGVDFHSVTGVKVGGNGVNAWTNVIQGNSGVTNGTSQTLTYPNAFGSTFNGCFSFFFSAAGVTATFIPRASWTELREFADASLHLETQFRAANDTDASFTNGTSGINAGIAIELVADDSKPIITTGQLIRRVPRIWTPSFVISNAFLPPAPVPPQFHCPGILVKRQVRIY